jgi:hypothetical protein
MRYAGAFFEMIDADASGGIGRIGLSAFIRTAAAAFAQMGARTHACADTHTREPKHACARTHE